MNFQFSLPASNSVKSSISNVQQQADNSLSAESQITNIKTAKDIRSKELQGVQLTLGQQHLIQNIERAVKALEGPQTTLDISIHEKTHDIMVKVLNKETGEIIREVPPEKTLDLVANLMEIAGIIVDEKI
ncbi:MAG: flagellar protein FlaG [Paenibacillus sp.]|uniref:flagellar protein FlaG n=1 Tax=Paenibacillus TaxID=44249 RepID=UPI001059AE6F|nr:flagellar protein FlaG [Paenibacillus amylolyticus]TDL65259.1 flagellar protein FlaG [Paenibacillus amylolyticus]